MRHGSFVLFESKAIATYIDRKFQGPPLVPAAAESAAQVEQWGWIVRNWRGDSIVTT